MGWPSQKQRDNLDHGTCWNDLGTPGLPCSRRFMVSCCKMFLKPPCPFFTQMLTMFQRIGSCLKECVQFPSSTYLPMSSGLWVFITIQNTTRRRYFILMPMYIIIVHFLREYKISCNLGEVETMFQWTWHTQETTTSIIYIIYDDIWYKCMVY